MSSFYQWKAKLQRSAYTTNDHPIPIVQLVTASPPKQDAPFAIDAPIVIEKGALKISLPPSTPEHAITALLAALAESA